MDNVFSNSPSSAVTKPFAVNEELSFEDAWVRVAELPAVCGGDVADARGAAGCAAEGGNALGGDGEDGGGSGCGVYAA